MAWEFAALAAGISPDHFVWVWRILSDDAGQVVRESAGFETLEACIADAKKHGFE